VRVRRLLSIVVMIGVSTACASHPGRSSERVTDPTENPTGRQTDVGFHETPPPPDWTDPLLNGLKIDSSSEADVPFDPVDPPPEVGQVQLIEATDPAKLPSESRGIAWVLDDGPLVFDLAETVPTMSQAQLEQLATCQPGETGCSTVGWSLVDIGTGVPALLIEATSSELPGSATSITWLDGDVLFEILGPVQGLSADSAVAKATALAAVT